MTKTVLTFGDSNTYGTRPAHQKGDGGRFGPDVRWPMVMERALGIGWAVIEEGLPGRTTNRADPVMGAHMDGQLGLRIALESKGPIDLLTIMLGSNDVQTHHCASVDDVIAGLAGLLLIARSEPYQTRHNGFDILLIAPPVVLEEGTYKDTQLGARAKSQALPDEIAKLAAHWDVGFFDASAHVASSPIDGVHFTAQDHVTLGKALAAKIGAL